MVTFSKQNAQRLMRTVFDFIKSGNSGRIRIAMFASVLLGALVFLGGAAFVGGSQAAHTSDAELASHRRCETRACTKYRQSREAKQAKQLSSSRAKRTRVNKPTPATSTPVASTPVANSGTVAPPVAAGWTPVFLDDFNGSSVDTTKWGVYEGRGNAGIGTRVRSAVTVNNGELQINATGTASGGMGSKYSGTYGLYEVRARVDKNTSYNTAVLLWPKSEKWPEGGEIDISEIFARDNATRMGSFAHWGSDNQQVYHFENADFTQWHTFGVDWQADHLTYYLDGREIWRVTKPEAIPHSPHFLAVQFDVSKYATSSSQATFHVDWARISQRA